MRRALQRRSSLLDADTASLFSPLSRRVTGGVPLSLYSGPESRAAWSALGARLKTWKQNVHTVLTTLNLSQQMQPEEAEEL